MLVLFIGAQCGVLLANNHVAEAIMCNGTTSTTDCLVQEVANYTGKYKTITKGKGLFEDRTGDSLSITIPSCAAGPATIVKAELQWVTRDEDSGFIDPTATLAVDGGTVNTLNASRQYKATPTGSLFYMSNSVDITSLVQPGTHTYVADDIQTSNTPGIDTTQWGFAIHAVYECAEFPEVTIYQKDGLDLHWWNWSTPYAKDRSELMCTSFSPISTARTARVDISLPGAASPEREADIWYKTGSDTMPGPTDYDLLVNADVAANGGQVLDRLVLRSDDPEWDDYQADIPLAANDTYVCIQVDSSFAPGQHPTSATASGASMFSSSSWVAIPTGITPPTPTLSLGDTIWNDTNNNGTQDAGENGISDVTVQLFRDTNSDGQYTTADGTTPVATQTTDSNGKYLFAGLAEGDYLVVIPASQFAGSGPLSGYKSSSGTNGSVTGPFEPAPDPDTNTNSDDNGSLSSGLVRSGAVTLALNSEPTNDGDTDANTNLTVDFGFYRPARLGDTVWIDTNKNGQQDTGENGVPNVTVTLKDGTGNTVGSTTTGSDGKYIFDNLNPGSYTVTFTNIPSGHTFTTPNTGNDVTDSDANSSGNTGSYTLNPGDENLTVDAGLVSSPITPPTPTLSLGDTIWNDTNNNGTQDAGENGISDVTVQLFRDTNSDGQYTTADGTTPVATQTTDSNGKYLFAGLAEGDYLVVIPASQFAGSGPLSGYKSSSGTNGSVTGPFEPAPDPDTNTNSDDNGSLSSGLVRSGAVTLALNSEPTNDGDTDANTNLTVDFGFYRPARLGDTVWIDTNKNGQQDTGENGVPNVTVTLKDGTGNTVGSTTTGSDGKYIFDNLNPGSYTVTFTNIPSGHTFTTPNTGNDVTDSDANSSGNTGSYTLNPGDENLTVDAGLKTVDTPIEHVEQMLAKTGMSMPFVLSLCSIMIAMATSYLVIQPWRSM